MFGKRRLLVAAGCLLALVCLVLLPGKMAEASPTSHYMYLPFVVRPIPVEHRHGDWIVTGHEVVEGGRVLLSGNLFIRSGGSLTLRNTKLTLNATQNGEYGIRVESGGAMTIEVGSEIAAASQEAGYTFLVEDGSDFLMRDSELHGCGWGSEYVDPLGSAAEPWPESWDVAGLVIEARGAVVERSDLSHNFVGVVVSGTSILISDNRLTSSVYNSIVVLGSENTIQGNWLYQVRTAGYARSMELYGSSNAVLTNTVSSQSGLGGTVSGIVLYHSWNNRIANNNLFDLNGGGITVGSVHYRACNNAVTGNTLSVGESALNVQGQNNLVSGNRVLQAQAGIEVMNSYDNVIAGNELNNIGILHGMRLTHSSGNTIVNNRVSVVDSIGILMWNRSQDNLIQGNTIEATTERGLALYYDCDDNVIRDNTISVSQGSTILLDDVANNVIYRNNFSSAAGQPYDDGANRWDEGGAGNYWSDYTGRDLDGDGVGDQPHSIPRGGVDRYPFMQPVTLEAGVEPTISPIPYQEAPAESSIQGTTIWESEELSLDYEITVQRGGRLILRDVTLALGSEVHPGSIWVAPGGTLEIYRSRLTDSVRGCGAQIVVDEGAGFIMQDSAVRGIYYSWWNEGFEIYGDGAIMTGNVLTAVNLTLIDVSSATIHDNTFRDALASLWSSGSQEVAVTNNVFDGSIWWAINFGGEASNGNLVANNTFSDTWSAISIYEGTATVMGNTITGGNQGISLSSGNLVEANQVSVSGTAIQLYGETQNEIRHNSVSGDSYGINIMGSTANTVTHNTITHSECGAFVTADSSGNMFHHNDFLANEVQAADFGENQWDDGREGNYWSDYTGTDSDGDGIGDTPYVVAPKGLDRYPLMTAQGGLPWKSRREWLEQPLAAWRWDCVPRLR